LAFLVIIHRALNFSQGHLQGIWSLRRGGVLTETGQKLSMEWGMWLSTGGLRVGIESLGLREVRGVEASEASKPDFTDVTVPLVSPSSVRGRGAELGAGGRGG
jgi:hypothetical protein